MNFSLVVRSGRPKIEDFADDLRSAIESAGGGIAPEGVPGDLVVAVGGDGTMLGAAHLAIEWDVPVIGFNLGTLGFLTEADPGQLEDVVGRLINAEYSISERLTIAASVDGRLVHGINDVVIEKIDSTRLVILEVTIDGTLFATYRADGLIFATPTGSTAYSFSAGGPVIDPRVDSLVLTPVAAHSLFDRPVVLPSNSQIEVVVRRDRPVRVNVDKTALGQITEGDTVRIAAGERPVRFVTFNSTSFAGLVRDKFGLD